MGTDWVRISLLLEPEMAEAVNEWRRQQPDLPDRNEAIRRLLGAALREFGISNKDDQGRE